MAEERKVLTLVALVPGPLPDKHVLAQDARLVDGEGNALPLRDFSLHFPMDGIVTATATLIISEVRVVPQEPWRKG